MTERLTYMIAPEKEFYDAVISFLDELKAEDSDLNYNPQSTLKIIIAQLTEDQMSNLEEALGYAFRISDDFGTENTRPEIEDPPQ